jgi:hypothetical protein
LIFDEWITSSAHPALAAHELIPQSLVDDDKAVQDMLAEAMEDSVGSVPVKGVVKEVGAVDVPVQTETRPRSSSSLSVRSWAGIFVGRGEARRNTPSPFPLRPKLVQKRSFSAPESMSGDTTEELEANRKGTTCPTLLK